MAGVPNMGWGWAEPLLSQCLGYRSQTWGEKTRRQLFLAHSWCVTCDDSLFSASSQSEWVWHLVPETRYWLREYLLGTKDCIFLSSFMPWLCNSRQKRYYQTLKGQGRSTSHIPGGPTKYGMLSMNAVRKKTNREQFTEWGPQRWHRNEFTFQVFNFEFAIGNIFIVSDCYLKSKIKSSCRESDGSCILECLIMPSTYRE